MWLSTNFSLNSCARRTAVSRSLGPWAASTIGFLPWRYGRRASSFRSRLGAGGVRFLSRAASAFFFLCLLCELLLIVLRVEKSLTKLRGHAHARLRKLALLPRFIPALLAGEVEGHGDVAHQQHFGSRWSG